MILKEMLSEEETRMSYFHKRFVAGLRIPKTRSKLKIVNKLDNEPTK